VFICASIAFDLRRKRRLISPERLKNSAIKPPKDGHFQPLLLQNARQY
jgi:hypothetical protein